MCVCVCVCVYIYIYIYERKIIGCICEREMLAVQPWCILVQEKIIKRIEWDNDWYLLLAGRNLIWKPIFKEESARRFLLRVIFQVVKLMS
jgi:hypothetical protein